MGDPVRNPFRFALRHLPPLRPVDVALVVVDMQYFDAHPDWGEGRTATNLGVLPAFDEYFAILGDAMPRMQRLLRLAREKGIEVIHVRVAEVTNDSRDVGWKQLARGLVVPKDSKEAQLLDEVAPLGDEIVISKSSSGVFATTNLDRLLRNLGITTLILVGTSTSGCVESAACDAADLGYTVIVARDACACSTASSHRLALERMAGASIVIASTAELSASLEAGPAVDRDARSGVSRARDYVPATAPAAGGDSPYHLIFGPALRQSVEPESTALLLQDVQRFACDPATGLGGLRGEGVDATRLEQYYARVGAAVPKMALVLEAARRTGCLVVFAGTASHTPNGRDLSPRTRSLGRVPVVGAPDAEWLSDVRPRAGEVVLVKPAAGVCTGTGVDELLRNAGIKTVILLGISYDGGVEGSLRSLTDRGYGVVLVPDACASFDDALQTHLWRAETGIINVTSAAALASQLSAARSTGAIERPAAV